MCPERNWPGFCQRLEERQLIEITEQIADTGFYVQQNLLNIEQVQAWQYYIEDLQTTAAFSDAKIGKKESESIQSNIRSDKIFWIQSFEGPTKSIGDWLDSLKFELKNYFRVPVDFIESHFAIYPSGSFYAKHIDNAVGQNHRMFTFIIYLNPAWQEGHGGELVLYNPKDSDSVICQIEPRGGTFVLFRSDLFYHEVLPTVAPRYTLTGWMRRHARV